MYARYFVRYVLDIKRDSFALKLSDPIQLETVLIPCRLDFRLLVHSSLIPTFWFVPRYCCRVAVAWVRPSPLVLP